MANTVVTAMTMVVVASVASLLLLLLLLLRRTVWMKQEERGGNGRDMPSEPMSPIIFVFIFVFISSTSISSTVQYINLSKSFLVVRGHVPCEPGSWFHTVFTAWHATWHVSSQLAL
jgi:ABC-type multidrug transport system permease subunit